MARIFLKSACLAWLAISGTVHAKAPTEKPAVEQDVYAH